MALAWEKIDLLILDVDGVLTDGRLFFGSDGTEFKAFNTLDGHGIKMLQQSGTQVAIITGRTSPLTQRRASDLGIKYLVQGREDKATAMRELLSELNIPAINSAYMGDDLPDLGAVMQAGIGISVPNACKELIEHCQYCTQRSGGQGAVREVCELILDAKNPDNAHIKQFLA